ncbi:MAG: hypothetical protein QXT77_03515 [Candidatus Methanomethylicaceae archaeon]
MVAFPEKRETERRKGHHTGQKTREAIPRDVGEQIKAMVKELLERLMQKAAGLVPCGTSHQGQRVLHPKPPYPYRSPGRISRSPHVRDRGFRPRVPLPTAYVPGAFKSRLGPPIGCGGEHPSHLPIFREDLTAGSTRLRASFVKS